VTRNGNDGQMLRIAVDAMGGDYAPEEVVKGAVQAARELAVEIILVGPKAEVEGELGKYDTSGLPLRLVEATEVIKDGEQPVLAVMRKPNSSVALATKLIEQGEADAMVSAGSTGACMVCAMQYLGTLGRRPANGRWAVPSVESEDIGLRHGGQCLLPAQPPRQLRCGGLRLFQGVSRD